MRTRAFRSSFVIVAMSAVALMAVLTGITFLAGCNGGGGGNLGGGGTPTVSSVTASVTPASVVVGSSAQASCAVHMSDGSAGTGGCTYSSSSTTVASVDAASGVVTTKTVGTATITATSTLDPSRSGPATLTVTAVPSNVTVTVNRAAVLGENGAKTVMSGNVVVTHSGSSDTAFSCVSGNANLVTINNPATCTYTPAATGSGDATITVTAHADNSKTATFTVHVGNWVLADSGGATDIVDLNKGTSAIQLLPTSAGCSYPAISYAASMFVCEGVSLTSNDAVLQIYQTDGMASGTKLLASVDLTTQAGLGFARQPSFSPGGTKIVFSSPTSGGAQAVYVINTDWTGLKLLFTEVASGVAISPVHFTPNGKQIMFENVSTMTVWIMDADSSNPQPFISAPSNTAMYSIDADGSMSTLYYSDGSSTYVEDAATGKVTATIGGYVLMGVFPNDGGILLTKNYANLYTAPADGVGTPTLLSAGGWGSAY
jgi:hypothetical protein